MTIYLEMPYNGRPVTLAYRNKQELINCLRSDYSTSGMGYWPQSNDTIADILAGMRARRVTAATARLADASWATNGQSRWL